MVVIMFEEAIAQGFTRGKRTTIRATCKPGVRVGAEVSLRIWSGAAYRSKTFEFATAIIGAVHRVTLTEEAAEIDGNPVAAGDRLLIAKEDGFDTWGELVEFFGKRAKKNVGALFFSGFMFRFDRIRFAAGGAERLGVGRRLGSKKGAAK